jgi:hypothetical protein
MRASAAIMRHTSAVALARSMACGSLMYFLLVRYPAWRARSMVQVEDWICCEPLRRPETVTDVSDWSSTQTSCPACWTTASIVLA